MGLVGMCFGFASRRDLRWKVCDAGAHGAGGGGRGWADLSHLLLDELRALLRLLYLAQQLARRLLRRRALLDLFAARARSHLKGESAVAHEG